MLRKYCDDCGEEVPQGVARSIVLRQDEYGPDGKMEFFHMDLCKKCYEKARSERKWQGMR